MSLRFGFLPLFVLATLAAPALAAPRTVPFPFQSADNLGNQWQFYANGMGQQIGGNTSVFSQLAQINVNGVNAPPMRGGLTGKFDDKTGEPLLENLNIGGTPVTRRITLNRDDGSVRYVDTFRNASNREQTLNIQYSSNFNFGIQSGRIVTDPRKKDLQLGWAGMTQGNRAVHQAYAFGNPKTLPRIIYPEGGNVLQAAFALTIPAGKEVSVLHYHGSTDTLDKAADAVTSLKPARLLANLDSAQIKSLANVGVRSNTGEELDLLRGETLDIIETRNGDQLQGTLKETTYTLTTPYAKLDLPADKVVALFITGRKAPAHLLVTTEGEIFGGTLGQDALTFQLSSSQTVKVPLAQIARAGYRKRPGEPDDLRLSRPAIFLRTGERMAVTFPASSIDVASRFGPLQLPSNTIASIALRNEDSPFHQITLTDGSRFAGLLTAPTFTVTLDGVAGKLPITLPTTALARLRPTPLAPDDAPTPPNPNPTLRCTGEDQLVGTLDATLLLDTAFEPIRITGDQVRKLARPETTAPSPDLQVTLWDQTLLTGQPQGNTLTFKLTSGPTLTIPADLILDYTNPTPRPSADMTQRIKDLVAKLNDDDFKARELAQQTLAASGPAIAPILKELRESQPPEAQQRIDQILAQLDK